MNYNSKECPPNYKCSVCGAIGCKLWRGYNCSNVELHCAGCAAKKEKKDISDINQDGKYTGKYGKTDQIGFFVPAVPDEEGVGYWGYTSVPPAGCMWWRNLRTRPVNPQSQDALASIVEE